jgi:hypothetical protein
MNENENGSVSYWVLVSDELLRSDPMFEEAGLHLVERGGVERPGMRWCKFKDDNADASLEGKEVNLAISLVDGKPVVTYREARVTGHDYTSPR